MAHSEYVQTHLPDVIGTAGARTTNSLELGTDSTEESKSNENDRGERDEEKEEEENSRTKGERLPEREKERESRAYTGPTRLGPFPIPFDFLSFSFIRHCLLRYFATARGNTGTAPRT